MYKLNRSSQYNYTNISNSFLKLLIILIGFSFLFSCEQIVNKESQNELLSPVLNHPAGKNFRYGQQNESVKLFGNKVLALYKSSDQQSDKENEIFYYLSSILEKMGFVVEYWDIDSGIPDSYAFKNIRAVISWFRSSSMKDPESYLDFLDRMMKSGRKLIVIDNFGAWQKRDIPEPENYVSPARVNLTLSKLGLWYLGDWTSDGNLIEIVDKVPEMVEKGGPQNAQISSFYYHFLKVDKNLEIYLSLKRKDMNNDPSPVITINKNGGFIFSQYIYRQEDGKINILIDFERYLKTALFSEPKTQKVLILADQNEPYSNKISTLTLEMLKRTKIDFDILYKNEFEFLVKGNFNSYSAVILILSNDQNLRFDILEDYLVNGGSVCSLLPLYSQNLPSLFNSEFVTVTKDDEKEGYRIYPGFTLGENLELKQEEFHWKPGYFKPTVNNRIWAESLDDNYPMMWTGTNGKGNYLIWNWDGFLGAENLGLIVESILSIMPIGITSTLGGGHMFIDDWPLPMYNIEKETLGITDTEYYTQIWWPDIKKLFSKYNIPYSTYLVFNYNATVTPPFTGGEFFVADNNMSYQIASEILNSNIEMGFHGYNHMSLTMEDTEVNLEKWPSTNAMEASLQEGVKSWESLFGKGTLPVGYVAVNNIISEEGIAAIKNVFPTIKFISALHWGVEEETYTPIGPHPILPETYYLPRITFGYQNSHNAQNLLASGVSGPGLISHFIHPDDVFDPYRSKNKDWNTLISEFEEFLIFQKQQYPWIKWMKLREIYEHLVNQDNSLLNICYDTNKIIIEGTPGQLVRIKYNKNSIKQLKGMKILYQYQQHPTLIAELNSIYSEIDF